MVQGVHGFDGLTYDGQSLWVSSNASNELYKVSLSGAILEELAAPSRYPFGLAFDGQNLWLADGTDRIFELTPDGDILCEFSVPTDYPGGLAWGDDKLWLTEYGGSQSLFGIEPDASCNTGVAVITDELQTPGGNSYGITWDGTHLLVASDKLYKVTTAGYLAEVYNLPVVSVKDIAWDGEAVWLLNQGPINVWGCDPVISRFRLRPCPPEPALRVSKQATPNPIQAGERLTYTIHITNTGNVDLHTTITDILPIQITPGNTSSGTLILPGGVLTWTPTITTPSGVWMEKVVVTAEMGYTGPLTNMVQVTTDEGATGTSTSIVTVAEELIVAEPGRAETIVVTSTDGLTTTVEVPSDAVTESTQLAYTTVPTITGSPSGFGFAGHAFNLDAYRNGDQIAGFTFSVPITITLHYTETDVVGPNEDMLVLEYWHDSTGVWEDAACGPYDRHPDENWLAVPVSHLSRFALFGRTLHTHV